MQTPTGSKLVQDPKRIKLKQDAEANRKASEELKKTEPANKAIAGAERTVKVQVLRPLSLDQPKAGEQPMIFTEGQVVLVSEDEAVELCDIPHEGFYHGTGNSDGKKQEIYKARRL